MSIFNVFIGFDERESLAYDLCAYSLTRRSSIPLKIHKLDHRKLRKEGHFDRPWTIDGMTGRIIDQRDGRPASTQFSHTRFLVPHLCKEYNIKEQYAMFVDCDFVFLGDIKELANSVKHKNFPLFCVKHQFTPKTDKKMDGQYQKKYPMKLWSSLMVFNLEHERNAVLTNEEVNYRPGSWLHGFSWLKEGPRDSAIKYIEAIDPMWNFIPNHSEPYHAKSVDAYEKEIRAIHYTEGMPFMEGYEHCRHSEFYYRELKSLLEERGKIAQKVIV